MASKLYYYISFVHNSTKYKTVFLEAVDHVIAIVHLIMYIHYKYRHNSLQYSHINFYELSV